MKQRIDSIDVARGLAMLIVIIQHCGAFSQFILSFHMPLFFMVSGLVVSGAKPNQTFLQEIKKNAQRLLIPQLTLGLLECLFIIISTYYYEHRFEILEFAVVVKAILRWWFLLVLFQCRILLWVFKRYIFGSKIKEVFAVFILLGLSVVTYLIPGHLNNLPVYMNLVPICLLFILVGYYIKDFLVKKMSIVESITLFLLLAITIIVSQINTTVVMYNMEIGNMLKMIVISFVIFYYLYLRVIFLY